LVLLQKDSANALIGFEEKPPTWGGSAVRSYYRSRTTVKNDPFRPAEQFG
jgi:hypothetical protein